MVINSTDMHFGRHIWLAHYFNAHYNRSCAAAARYWLSAYWWMALFNTIISIIEATDVGLFPATPLLSTKAYITYCRQIQKWPSSGNGMMRGRFSPLRGNTTRIRMGFMLVTSPVLRAGHILNFYHNNKYVYRSHTIGLHASTRHAHAS